MTITNTMDYNWTIPNDPALLLRAELADVLAVSQTMTSRSLDGGVRFVGRLLQSAESAFPLLEQRFKRLGYTPLLRREGEDDVVLALYGVVRPATSNPLVNVLLFLVTVASTVFAGAYFTNPIPGMTSLEGGVLFSAAILLILGTHEFGHYFMARFHHLAVTLPYFIPFPIGGIGTLGAFIRMKSPVHDRKTLFDVAVAGPLAGLIVAIPLLAIGLALSPVLLGMPTVGKPILGQVIMDIVRPHPAGTVLLLHPIAWAALIGLLVTGINLLPAGQLDGGHTAYAVFGRNARWLGWLTIAAIGALALITREPGWYLWLFFIFATGMTHAEPLNDITPLDTSWKIVGVGTLFLLFLLLSPSML